MNERQYHSEDQINFAGLKNTVWAFLQEFFRFIAFTQNTIRRKLLYIIGGAIFGVGIAIIYFNYKPQVYKADMLLIFNRLTKRTYGEVLSQLNMMVTTGAHDRLANDLQITPDLARQIILIDGTNMNNRPLITDTSSRPNQAFKINIVLKSNVAVDALEKGLVSYINNLPYLKKVAEIERQNQQDRLSSIEKDLAKLDTLKTEYNRFLASSKTPSTVYNSAVNPAEFYEQSTMLHNLRDMSRRTLYVEDNALSVIGPLKVIKTPRSRPLLDLMLIIGSIGLFTGFLLGLLIETRQVVLPNKS